eukprot:13925632-Heterocapsa_arctica.AAC.1
MPEDRPKTFKNPFNNIQTHLQSHTNLDPFTLLSDPCTLCSDPFEPFSTSVVENNQRFVRKSAAMARGLPHSPVPPKTPYP